MTTPRFELTSQRQKVSRLPTEPPGRPAVGPIKVQAWGELHRKIQNPADSRDRQYSLQQKKYYISNETLVGSFCRLVIFHRLGALQRMLCFHRTIIILVDRIGIPGSKKKYLIVSKTGSNSVYCTRFQEEHIKSTCFYCARTYLLVCTQYYGPIYYVFLRPNCVLLLHTRD